MSNSENDQITDLNKRLPAKRTTRLTSKAMAEQEALINQLKIKREHCYKVIKHHAQTISDDEKFNAWTKGELNERIKKLENTGVQLNEILMQLICVDNDDDNEDTSKELENEEIIISLKAKLNDRIDQLSDQVSSQIESTQARQVQVVEVQHTDITGNVVNTWGTFDGDYAKWKSFRDRWMTLHENPKVKTVIKFQNLKTACVG